MPEGYDLTFVYVRIRDKDGIAAQKLNDGNCGAVIYNIGQRNTRVMCLTVKIAEQILAIFPHLKRIENYEGYPVLQCDYDVLTDTQIRAELEKQGNPVLRIKV